MFKKVVVRYFVLKSGDLIFCKIKSWFNFVSCFVSVIIQKKSGEHFDEMKMMKMFYR